MNENPLIIHIAELPEGETFIAAALTPVGLGFSDEDVTLTSPVAVEVRLQKLRSTILADASTLAQGELTCGRCTERYTAPLKGTMVVEYVPASEAKREEGEGENDWVVPYHGNSVDLVDDVRQTVLLSLPMKRVCRADCKGLCPQCGVNLNRGGCHCYGES